jgi:hypothetical protein
LTRTRYPIRPAKIEKETNLFTVAASVRARREEVPDDARRSF